MVRKRVEVIALCLAVLVYTGLVPVYTRNPFSSVIQEQSIKSISGTVISSPVKMSSGKSYSVGLSVSRAASDVTHAACSGNVVLYVPAADIEAFFPGKLYSSANIKGNKSEEIIPFIEEGCKLSADVVYSGIVPGDSLSILSGNLDKPAFSVKNVTGCVWEQSFSYFRAYLRLQLKRLLAAWGTAGGLLLALLCGAREYTDTSISDAFRKAGLSHILALSGMHLSLFSGLSDKTAGKLVGRRYSPYLSLCASFLFVWFAGLSPSLLRAIICMSIGVFASVFCFRTTPLKTLSLAFVMHLLISPEDAGSLAFMLSYLALCGVYAGDKFLKNPLCRFIPPPLASAFSASIGAQVFTFPLSVTISGTIIPAAVFASVAVSPIASCFVTGGIISVLLVLFMPFLLQPVGSIISLFYNVFTYLVRFFAGIPCIKI